MKLNKPIQLRYSIIQSQLWSQETRDGAHSST